MIPEAAAFKVCGVLQSQALERLSLHVPNFSLLEISRWFLHQHVKVTLQDGRVGRKYRQVLLWQCLE
jgi:hypothetical protein